jgi:hypothetical protein
MRQNFSNVRFTPFRIAILQLIASQNRDLARLSNTSTAVMPPQSRSEMERQRHTTLVAILSPCASVDQKAFRANLGRNLSNVVTILQTVGLDINHRLGR